MNSTSSFSLLNNQASLKPMSHLRSGNQNPEHLIESTLTNFKDFLQQNISKPLRDRHSWSLIKAQFESFEITLKILCGNQVVKNPTEKMTALLNEIKNLRPPFLALVQQYETYQSPYATFKRNRIF